MAQAAASTRMARDNAWDTQNRLSICESGGTTSTFTYGADGLGRGTAAAQTGRGSPDNGHYGKE